jgi:hypothetical protein
MISIFRKIEKGLSIRHKDETEDTKSVKITKETMKETIKPRNHCLNEMQLLITKQSNTLSDVQSTWRTRVPYIRNSERASTYTSIARSELIYIEQQKDTFSLNITTTKKKQELINKVNPRMGEIKGKSIGQTKAKSIVMDFETRSDP